MIEFWISPWRWQHLPPLKPCTRWAGNPVTNNVTLEGETMCGNTLIIFETIEVGRLRSSGRSAILKSQSLKLIQHLNVNAVSFCYTPDIVFGVAC